MKKDHDRVIESERNHPVKAAAATFIVFLMTNILPANAAPLPPNPVLTGDIVQVHGGCGVGFHRTSTGICRRDGTVMVPLFGTCPSGYVRGARGRCVRR